MAAAAAWIWPDTWYTSRVIRISRSGEGKQRTSLSAETFPLFRAWRMIAVLQWQPQRPKEGLCDRTCWQRLPRKNCIGACHELFSVAMKFKHYSSWFCMIVWLYLNMFWYDIWHDLTLNYVHFTCVAMHAVLMFLDFQVHIMINLGYLSYLQKKAPKSSGLSVYQAFACIIICFKLEFWGYLPIIRLSPRGRVLLSFAGMSWSW